MIQSRVGRRVQQTATRERGRRYGQKSGLRMRRRGARRRPGLCPAMDADARPRRRSVCGSKMAIGVAGAVVIGLGHRRPLGEATPTTGAGHDGSTAAHSAAARAGDPRQDDRFMGMSGFDRLAAVAGWISLAAKAAQRYASAAAARANPLKFKSDHGCSGARTRPTRCISIFRMV